MANQSDKKSHGQAQLGALAAHGQPHLDLVGPSAGDDIRRAISRYGPEAVKIAVKEATKAKRGRKREPDWPELREIIESDARDWLDGKDPLQERSNYAIAKLFAERNPGHSVVSTHKRIERKLSKRPYGRQWLTLVAAKIASLENYPFAAHIRALEALASLPDAQSRETWGLALAQARATVADYEAREGVPPPSAMSFAQVEDVVRNGGLAAFITPRSSPKLASSGLGAILSATIKGAD